MISPFYFFRRTIAVRLAAVLSLSIVAFFGAGGSAAFAQSIRPAAAAAGRTKIGAKANAATSTLAAAPLVSDDIVISQVYGGGGNTGATFRNDFIELFNRSAAPITITGWTVQYASATGNTWQTTALTGTIPAGGYYLVQEAQGAGGTVALPTPDATGTITMSATAAKVALVTNSTALTCGATAGSCLPNPAIKDFVGYGTTANNFEGAAPAPAPSNTNADLRASAGCVDTDANSADFTVVAPAPRNSATTANACTPGGAINPSGIGAATPSSVPDGAATLLTVTVTPGSNPVSTDLNVTANLTAIGGAGVQEFFDDGTNGDAQAGDNIFSFQATVALGTTAGAKSLPVTITDGENRTGSANIALTVTSSGPTALSATGAANPTGVSAGGATLLTVRVTPATVPASTGITVTADLSSIGGAANQMFFDDGTNGDVTPGDNLFSFAYSIPAATATGARSLPVAVADAQTRTATASIAFTVLAPADPNEHLTLGNPTNATADANQPFNYLLPKAQFAISYHRDRGIPNWVSWHLDSTWLGTAPRQNDFRPDETLPAGWPRVLQTDYSGSGFDRGHHTPSADRTRSIPDNSATFLMTNMMPQAPDNNQGPWEQLESYCRTLVGQGSELYIVAGGYGTGGTGSNGGVTNTVANGKVTVPALTWKVIVVLSTGENDVARVTANTRAFAVIMPNRQGIRTEPWQKYLATVDQVEALTGYDYFSNVPVSIQNQIEARLDTVSNIAPATVAGGTYANLDVTAPNTALTGSVTVTGTLNLEGSTLSTGNNKVTLAPGAVVARFSGYVNGTIEKQFNDPNAADFEFPVGTANGYSPVTADLTALGQTGSSLAVRAVQAVHPAAFYPNNALRRYWVLTENGDLTANLTFQYRDADVPSAEDESRFRLYRYETDFVTIPAIVNPAANTATAAGINQFSDWTLLSAPSAASVNIGGRVVSAEGRGVAGARVYLTDSNGATRTAMTNNLGYYRFADVGAGETYVLNVLSKRFSFEPQVVTITEEQTDLNFTAAP